MSEPFLRPAPAEGVPSPPCPPGHDAELAGIWHGKPMEVVYDPRRHDVAFVRGAMSENVRQGLVSTGWRRQLTDGPNEMWTRDRSALTRSRLERVPAAPKLSRSA
ncbi:MAG: hypothetical protein ACRD2W_08915 [Acidimicrobiales bacterium]